MKKKGKKEKKKEKYSRKLFCKLECCWPYIDNMMQLGRVL